LVASLQAGALLGQEFKLAFLLNVYPIESHKSKIRRDLTELEGLGLIEERVMHSGRSTRVRPILIMM
jgi:hypothetical protein